MDKERTSFEESFLNLAINLFLEENEMSVYDLITFQDAILRIVMSYTNGKGVYFEEMYNETESVENISLDVMNDIIVKVHKFAEFHTKIARIVEAKD